MASYILKNGSIKSVTTPLSLSDGFLRGLSDYTGYNRNDSEFERVYYVSSIVFNAINLLSNVISNLPKKFLSYKQGVSVSTNVTFALGNTQHKLWSTLIRDYYLYGRFYLEPVKTSVGLRFKRINPSTMEFVVNGRGIQSFIQRSNTNVVTWDADDLIYVHNYNPSNDLTGLSLVGQALKEAKVDINLIGFIDDYFENGGTPLGILTTDQPIRPETAKQYSSNWRDAHSGNGKRNSIAVLGNNLTYKPITPSIKDISTDEVYLFIGRRISQLFGIPIDLLGVADYENRASSDNSGKNLYIHTIIPTFNIIASDIAEQSSIHFREEFQLVADEYGIDVLQNDREILTNRSTELFIKGVASLNEARQIAQLEPIENGNLHFIGGRLVPQENLNQPIEPLVNTVDKLQAREAVNPQNPKEAQRILTEKKAIDNQSIIDLIIADLKKYKSKALAKGSDKFESAYIPKTIKGFIKLDLRSASENKANIFDRYIAYFRDTDFTDGTNIEELNQFLDYWGETPYKIMDLSDKAYDIFFGGLLEELNTYSGSMDSLYDSIIKPRQIALTEFLRDAIGIYPIVESIDGNQKGILEDIGRYITESKNKVVEMVNNLTKTTMNGLRSAFGSNTFQQDVQKIISIDRIDTGIENITSSLKALGMQEHARLYNKTLRFKTQLDDRVCPKCQPFHNKVLIDGQPSPPVHLKCRCYLEVIDGI